MSPLGLGGLVLISRIPSLPTISLVPFHITKLGWMILSLCCCQLLGSFSACIHFNGIELYPIIEEFAAIMGEPDWTGDWWSHLPYHGWGSPPLLQVVLGIPSTTTNRWYVYGKLNLKLVFEYFSDSTLLVGERPHSYFLYVFCLCALARYFLVQNSYCVNLRMCIITYELKRGNLVGLISTETLNGLDAFHRKEVIFFAGSHLLLQV